MRNVRCGTSFAILALVFPMAALADLSQTVTLSSGQHLSLDTGATSSSGGDLLFSGTSLTPQGSAGDFALGALGSTDFSALTQSSVSVFPSSSFTQTPIGGTSLVVNEVFVVHTNGGNYSKVLITAVSSSALTLQFDTFGVSSSASGAGGPTITLVQNNYSFLVPGQPNYGIAPGTLFIIVGTNLASATTVSSLESSASPGLPTSLNGASVTVTVGGVTTNPAFYYAIATQLALVLPSSTPTGTGTVTVSYGGQNASAPITVVPSALGFDTLYGTGTGLAVATTGATTFNYNNSVAPTQEIVLWGSGLGADTADSDTTYTTTPHTINTPLQIYVGGILAAIDYQGSAGYPGLDQINITVPAGVQPGCAVAVVAVSGSIVSNTVTIPVNPGGGVCSDSAFGITGSELLTLGSKTNYNSGTLILSQSTSSTGVQSDAIGTFQNVQGVQSASGSGLLSIGNCILNAAITPNTVAPATTPLDAGSLSITGPTGTQSLTEEEPGIYDAQLPAGFIPALGGSFTFTGTGANVGAFTTTLNLSNLVVWTNMSSIAAVNRAQGVTVTWTGGSANGFVYINGSSSSTSGVGVSFSCYAASSAGQFTVPSYILDALPAGSGSLGVNGETNFQSFSASGLDYGNAFGFTGATIDSLPYN